MTLALKPYRRKNLSVRWNCGLSAVQPPDGPVVEPKESAMSSISITAVPVTDMDEPVQDGKQSAEKGKTKPTRFRKSRPLAAAASASTEQEAITVDVARLRE